MDVYQQLQKAYDSFYLGPDGKDKLLKGKVRIEKALIDRSLDTALGLNLIAKLPKENSQEVEEKFYQPLKKIIPHQYFYPLSDLHITFLDILPHRENFKINDKELEQYLRVFDDFFAGMSSFEVEFTGVLATAMGVGLRGFPVKNKLNDLRGQLRNKIVDAGLRNEEERKYRLESAHISCVRFIKLITPAVGKKLVEFIEQNEETMFTKAKFSLVLLNISGRFDKTEKIQIIKEYRF